MFCDEEFCEACFAELDAGTMYFCESYYITQAANHDLYEDMVEYW